MVIVRHGNHLVKIEQSLACVVYLYIESWPEITEAYSNANSLAKEYHSIKFFAVDAKNPEFEVTRRFDQDFVKTQNTDTFPAFHLYIGKKSLIRW